MAKKFKLNPVALKWIKALRSGKYKQGVESLAVVEDGKVKGYCCLGVLCELAVDEGIIKKHQNKHCIRYGGNKTGKTDVLPLKVQKWAGLRTNDGDLVDVWGSTPLTGWNDDHEKSFKWIAKYIEKKARELFD